MQPLNCTRGFRHKARAQGTPPDIAGGGGDGARVFTSLGSADLSQLRGSLRLRRSEEGARVLQSAAKGHLADLAVRAVAAHLAFVVWQHLGHGGGKACLAQRTWSEKHEARGACLCSAADPPRCSGDAPAVWRLSLWGSCLRVPEVRCCSPVVVQLRCVDCVRCSCGETETLVWGERERASA